MLSRLDALSSGDGLLHPGSLAGRLTAAAEDFRRLVPAESARWGDAAHAAQWEQNVSWLRETYVPQRTAIVAEQFRALFTGIERQAEAGALAARERGTSSLPGLSIPYRPAVVTADSSDRDGDGIPDEWETAHGLNPRDRNDGLADADGDGLSNLTEYLLGRDTGRAESLAGVFTVEPSGVHTRAQQPRIRGGVRVSIQGRALSPAEAAQAAAAEAAAAGPLNR